MLWEDRRDLVVVLVYNLISSLLLLAVPLTAQALVNTIAAGMFLQPLAVLTVATAAGLLFAGLMTVMKFTLVEVMRQRIFARVALRLAERLTRLETRTLSAQNPPELMNRFFDVVNIQKSWFKLVFEGPGAVVEVLVGLALLAIYGPLLLAFSLVLVASGLVILFGLGLGGVRTSIEESAQRSSYACSSPTTTCSRASTRWATSPASRSRREVTACFPPRRAGPRWSHAGWASPIGSRS